MKMKWLMGMLLFAFSLSSIADVSVKENCCKDSAYVQPHYRSDHHSTQYDNLPTNSNVNPYEYKNETNVSNEMNVSKVESGEKPPGIKR